MSGGTSAARSSSSSSGGGIATARGAKSVAPPRSRSAPPTAKYTKGKALLKFFERAEGKYTSTPRQRSRCVEQHASTVEALDAMGDRLMIAAADHVVWHEDLHHNSKDGTYEALSDRAIKVVHLHQRAEAETGGGSSVEASSCAAETGGAEAGGGVVLLRRAAARRLRWVLRRPAPVALSRRATAQCRLVARRRAPPSSSTSTLLPMASQRGTCAGTGPKICPCR